MRTKGSMNKGLRQPKQTKDGKLSLKLSPRVAGRVTEYCKTTNKNRTSFVENLVSEALDQLNPMPYENLTKSELIALLEKRDFAEGLKEQMSLFDLGHPLIRDKQAAIEYVKEHFPYDDESDYCSVFSLRHRNVWLPEVGANGELRDESNWAYIDASSKIDTGMYGDIYYF